MNDSVGKETWIQWKCSSIYFMMAALVVKNSPYYQTPTNHLPSPKRIMHSGSICSVWRSWRINTWEDAANTWADVHLNEIITSPVAVPHSQESALFKYMSNPLAVERWHVGSRETVCATELSVDFLVFLWVPMGRLYNSCESNFSTANEQECIKSLSVQSLLYSKTTCFLAAFIAQNDVCPRPDTVQTCHISLMANQRGRFLTAFNLLRGVSAPWILNPWVKVFYAAFTAAYFMSEVINQAYFDFVFATNNSDK